MRINYTSITFRKGFYCGIPMWDKQCCSYFMAPKILGSNLIMRLADGFTWILRFFKLNLQLLVMIASCMPICTYSVYLTH